MAIGLAGVYLAERQQKKPDHASNARRGLRDREWPARREQATHLLEI
jgi:hypothetical protein